VVLGDVAVADRVMITATTVVAQMAMAATAMTISATWPRENDPAGVVCRGGGGGDAGRADRAGVRAENAGSETVCTA
jgi:hypothetical protein